MHTTQALEKTAVAISPVRISFRSGIENIGVKTLKRITDKVKYIKAASMTVPLMTTTETRSDAQSEGSK